MNRFDKFPIVIILLFNSFLVHSQVGPNLEIYTNEEVLNFIKSQKLTNELFNNNYSINKSIIASSPENIRQIFEEEQTLYSVNESILGRNQILDHANFYANSSMIDQKYMQNFSKNYENELNGSIIFSPLQEFDCYDLFNYGSIIHEYYDNIILQQHFTTENFVTDTFKEYHKNNPFEMSDPTIDPDGGSNLLNRFELFSSISHDNLATIIDNAPTQYSIINELLEAEKQKNEELNESINEIMQRLLNFYKLNFLEKGYSSYNEFMRIVETKSSNVEKILFMLNSLSS